MEFRDVGRRLLRWLVRIWRKYRTVPLEAALIVFFSQLPVILATVLSRAAAEEGALQKSNFFSDMVERYSANDVFVYATGVLGSAVVYFVLRMRIIENRTRIFVTGVLIPLGTIFFAALIPTMLRVSDGQPNTFVQNYSFILLCVLVVAWLLALFEQRNIEERAPDISGEISREEAARRARGKIG